MVILFGTSADSNASTSLTLSAGTIESRLEKNDNTASSYLIAIINVPTGSTITMVSKYLGDMIMLVAFDD